MESSLDEDDHGRWWRVDGEMVLQSRVVLFCYLETRVSSVCTVLYVVVVHGMLGVALVTFIIIIIFSSDCGRW